MRLLFILLFAAVGCAEGANPVDPADDASTAMPSINDDMGAVTPDMIVEPVDQGPSCGVCCPGERSCSDETTRRMCKSDGSGFDTAPCVGDETCTDGVCAVPPVCSAGQKSCYDTTTVLTCRQTQDGFTTSPCPDDTTCVDGVCLAGAGVGQACSADSDCATNQCHCDAAEGCTGITAGYCTSTCSGDDCGRDGACFDASVAPLSNAAANYNHCVSKCTPGSCPTGQECISVPTLTAAGVVWELGCYFSGFTGIGDECSSDAQCIGGKCLLEYYTDPPRGFCTRDCSHDGVCPDDSACVILTGSTFVCSTLCGDGSTISSAPCPFKQMNSIDASCKVFSDFNNNAVRACYSP